VIWSSHQTKRLAEALHTGKPQAGSNASMKSYTLTGKAVITTFPLNTT